MLLSPFGITDAKCLSHLDEDEQIEDQSAESKDKSPVADESVSVRGWAGVREGVAGKPENENPNEGMW